MSFSVALANSTKIKPGSCPHGLPAGACPICSGMGGGGGSIRREDKQKTGEMTYDECFAIWQQMKAEQLAKSQKSSAIQAQFNISFAGKTPLVALSAKLADFSAKISDFATKLSQNHPILAKPLSFVAKNILIPTLNVIKNITNIAHKAADFVSKKLADISDKLTAVFGEIKNSSLKKMSDKFNDFKKKLGKFFFVSEPEKLNDNENKLETEKRIFDVKNLFQKIQKKFKNKKENEKYGSN